VPIHPDTEIAATAFPCMMTGLATHAMPAPDSSRSYATPVCLISLSWRRSRPGAIHAMAGRVREYVPGYALRTDPQFDPPRDTWKGMARVAILLQVRGRGDYLPDYAGNLDIITAAAARTGEILATARTASGATASVGGAS
jgi:acetaldehyde dehydrogenase (acetylating)